MIPTIEWTDAGIRILDQTRLPAEEKTLELRDLESICEAIASLRVRGAPAIGIAGAYGVAWMARQATGERRFDEHIEAAAQTLRTVRPTAVNLAWAVDRTMKRLRETRRQGGSPEEAAASALTEAQAILEEDLEASRRMGRAGVAILERGCRVLTHCNAGGLATGGLGTALAVIYEAARTGLDPHVYASETRPLLQGARLTAWEMVREKIRVTVVVDGARAWLMETRGVDVVLTGADRVAANGDAANKIGTLDAAILAARHGVPFYIVAPGSTFDFSVPSGREIPVELRAAAELRRLGEHHLAPEGAEVWNPAFDVTPASLISGWITERGILQPPFDALRD